MNRIPAVLRPTSESFPRDILGATLVQIGTPEDANLLEGGGLVIDYRPNGSDSVRRLVVAFNELGAWVEYQGLA